MSSTVDHCTPPPRNPVFASVRTQRRRPHTQALQVAPYSSWWVLRRSLAATSATTATTPTAMAGAEDMVSLPIWSTRSQSPPSYQKVSQLKLEYIGPLFCFWMRLACFSEVSSHWPLPIQKAGEQRSLQSRT